MKQYKLCDIYGNEFTYKCNSYEEAKECFIAENGSYHLEEDEDELQKIVAEKIKKDETNKIK